MAKTYNFKFEYNCSNGEGILVDSGQHKTSKKDVIYAMLDVIEHLKADTGLITGEDEAAESPVDNFGLFGGR